MDDGKKNAPVPGTNAHNSGIGQRQRKTNPGTAPEAIRKYGEELRAKHEQEITADVRQKPTDSASARSADRSAGRPVRQAEQPVLQPQRRTSPAESKVKSGGSVRRLWSVKEEKEYGEGKKYFDWEYFFNALTHIVIAIGALALVVYFSYHLVDTLTDTVSTAAVCAVTETEYRVADAYLIRDEVPVNSKYAGLADYRIKDGGRVAAGEKICSVYPDATPQTRARIDRIDREIALLEKSVTEGTVTMGMKDTAEKTNESYAQIMKRLASGDYTGAAEMADWFRTYLDRFAYLSGSGDQISTRLSLLISERSAEVASMGTPAGNVTAPKAGYFYSSCDGYEAAFSALLKNEITPADFAAAATSSPADISGTVGKLVSGSAWYIAVSAPAEDFRGFTAGKEYNITFTAGKGTEVSMKLEQYTVTDDGSVFMVFSSSRIPENMVWSRRQAVKIEYAVYDGYRVPVGAVHSYEGMTGVYTLHGGYVYFRRINIVYEGEGYFIVSRYADVEPGKPDIYYVLGFDPEGGIGTLTHLRKFAKDRGLTEKTHSPSAIPVVRGKTFLHYYYLDELENMIIKGKDLYHGKVLS